MAIKYNEDDYFSNEFYSKVGGISLQEINALEYESLILIKHTLFVEQEFFLKYKLYLDQYLKWFWIIKYIIFLILFILFNQEIIS